MLPISPDMRHSLPSLIRTPRRSGTRALLAGLAAAAAVMLLPASAPAAPLAHLNGNKAVAAKGAPDVIKDMIRAGNRIRDERYKWGGGHGDWDDTGYDCSGAVSYVLHTAGLLDSPLVSGDFMKWGRGGAGRQVTIYASKEHVFMVVAGLRWDTSYITDGDKSGPGWSEYMRPTKGFRVRHPAGL